MLNNLEDIIEKSSLGYEDKQLFKDIFGALYEEQEKMYKAISEKVEKENRFALRETKDKRSGEWEISTILTEKDTELNGVLYNIRNYESDVMQYDDVDRTLETEIFFLNCKYSEIYDICNNKNKYTAKVFFSDGKEKDVKYRIVRISSYIEREREMETAARLNNISRPFIFSPMSRRAVTAVLEFDEKPKDRITEIDLMPKENGFEAFLNYKLMWNVQIKEKEELDRPQKCDTGYYITKMEPAANRFWYPKNNENKRVEILEDGLRYEDISVDYAQMDIKPFAPQDVSGIVFSNKIKNGEKKIRLRTEADIAYAINMFAPDGLELLYKGFSEKNDGLRHISVYSRNGDRYDYIKAGMKRLTNMIYLRFADNGDVFFEDKVNYLIEFFNWYYPEFRWVAVYA